MSDPGLSADERGDTVPRWARWLIRVLAVAVFAGGTLAVALVREKDDQEKKSGATPTAPTAAVPADDPLAHAAQETRLLNREDARLRSASMGPAVGATRIGGSVVLGARPAPYSLGDLVRAGAATRTSTSVYELVRPVVVRRDARLTVTAPGVTLRLVGSKQGVASLVSWGGAIDLVGSREQRLTIVGWQDGAPDTSTADGRGYVRVKDGSLGLRYVDVEHLGFWSGRTGGLALTGSDDTTASARIEDVTVDDLHLGLYLSGARQVRVQGLTVDQPQRHGVEITNRSSGVRLQELTVTGAGEDAVSVGNGSARVRIEDAELTGSGGYGLDADGSPLADGPNSAGYGIGNYAWVSLLRSRVTRNEAGGVRVQSVDHVVVADTRVSAGRSALVVRGEAQAVTIDDSQLRSTDGSGVVLADGVSDAALSDSTVTGLEVGVDVEDSVAAIDDNEITVGTGHGVRIAGPEAEATLSGNVIHGRGSSAVDDESGATVSGGEESAGDWTYRPEVVMWAERNSAALPLLLVLVVPVIGLVFVLRRRRQQRELRRLFEASLVAQGRSAIAAYQPPPVLAAVAAAPVPEPQVVPEVEVVPEAEEASEAAPAAEPVGLGEREFASPREFAIAAVTEEGYSASMVARVLHVPTSRVRDWLAETESGLDQT